MRPHGVVLSTPLPSRGLSAKDFCSFSSSFLLVFMFKEKKKSRMLERKKEKQQFFNDILKVAYDSVQGHFWVHGALWQF